MATSTEETPAEEVPPAGKRKPKPTASKGAVRTDAPHPIIDATDGPASLVTKIALAMAEAGAVTKSSRNTDQGYKYASVEAILEATRGPLLRRGVALFQHPASVEEKEITARSGSKGSQVTVTIDFTFVDGASGDTYSIYGWAGQGIDYGDKAYGKAYTNAIKTFIRAQWLLPTGDDPEEESPERGSSNGGPPAWAAPANAAQKEELVKVLTGLLHGNQRAARSYAKILADTVGAFPTIVAAWLCALPAHREAAKTALENPDPPAPEPDGAADAAAQAASGEPEPAAGPEGDASPPAQTDASPGSRSDAEDGDEAPVEPPPLEDAPIDGEPTPVDRPPAGTVDPTPDAIAEHCTCETYGTLDEERGEKVDDGCPIQGHGIPF